MRKNLRTSTFILCAATILLGTQSCKTVKPIDKASLEGSWTLKSLNGENATDVFKGAIPTLQFNFEENRIHGNGGCNTYNGGFTLTDKNEFTAPNAVSTMRACIDANKEPQYFKALSTPSMVLALNNKALTFTKGKDVVFLFEKSEATAAAGEDVKLEKIVGSWVLSSIAGGDINELFTGNKPTMEITEDGKIFGHAGCNSYRTSYTLEGNTIVIKPAMGTKMACPSLKGEGLFTSHLTASLQVSANVDKISFLKDGKTVLEFVKAAQ